MATRGSKTVQTIARTRDAFLSALAETANVTGACRKAKLPRATAYQWKEADEAFAKAWDAALDVAADMLEDVAVQRATKGTLRPVYQGGVKVGTVREYSDRLLEVLLKAHKPGKYREHADVHVTGKLSLTELVQAARKPDGEAS